MNEINTLMYLAAHAPRHIPSWFRPAIKSVDERMAGLKRPDPELFFIDTVTESAITLAKDWSHDPVYDLVGYAKGSYGNLFTKQDFDELARFETAMREFRAKEKEATHARKQDRYFAWRLYFAEQLAQRLRTIATTVPVHR